MTLVKSTNYVSEEAVSMLMHSATGKLAMSAVHRHGPWGEMSTS